MKTNNANYKHLVVLLVISLTISLVAGIVGFILSDQLIRIILLVLFAIAIAGSILFAFLLGNRLRNISEDIKDINKSMDDIYSGEVKLVSPKSGNKDVSEVAYKVNDMTITNVSIKRGTIYKGSDFINEVSRLVGRGFVDEFAYVRMYNLSSKSLLKIKKENNNIYIAEGKNYYDIIFEVKGDRLDFEDYLRDYSVISSNKIIVIYSNDYSLKEMASLLAKDNELDNKLNIYKREDGYDSFYKHIDKYRKGDLNEKNLLLSYLKDMMKYLPFTHMGILKDKEYMLASTYESKRQILQLKVEDFPYHQYFDLFLYKGNLYSLVVVKEDEIFLLPEQKERLNVFIELLKEILITELSKRSNKEVEARYQRIEYLSNSLSYEVDDNFKIIHASNKLEMRHNNTLTGSICYKALYNRKKPCVNCPLIHKDLDHSDTYILGANRYSREVTYNEENNSNIIYLTNIPEPYVSTKEHLYDRLLGLINTEGSKGYLLCFKLDSLSSLADRNKTDVNDVVKEIIKLLRIYGLSDHLYRKDIDEFVYILEEASVADAVSISKQVSKAFLEKFNTNNKEVSFSPKMILLSYPLEVNTLFSLDSLCRTLFTAADKKGQLYRVDEESTPIDNNRYYMSIVEESYKHNSIPFSYMGVEDKKGNNLKYAYIAYQDNEGKHIREDEITLYCKINNTYLTLVERVSKALIDLDETDNHQRYILPIGKEALVPALFASIIGYFNSKKVKLDKIIFEVKEKDAYNHIEEINKIVSNGIILSMASKDNVIYDMDISFYRYIKVDGLKLSKDPLYQSKVNKIIAEGIDLMVEEECLPLLPNSRYSFKKKA